MDNLQRRMEMTSAPGARNGWVFDAACGWTLVNAVRAGSVDGSEGFYHYDPPLPGAVSQRR